MKIQLKFKIYTLLSRFFFFSKLSSELDWSLCQADSGPQALYLALLT